MPLPVGSQHNTLRVRTTQANICSRVLTSRFFHCAIKRIPSAAPRLVSAGDVKRRRSHFPLTFSLTSSLTLDLTPWFRV